MTAGSRNRTFVEWLKQQGFVYLARKIDMYRNAKSSGDQIGIIKQQ
jgi:hypothetical protein